MRRNPVIIGAIIILAVLWQGCGSKGGPTTGRGSGGGGGNAASYLLYADATAGTANVASIATSGILTTAASPAQTGVQPIAMAAAPDGKSVYVLNSSSSTVSQVVVATNGSLTQPLPAVGTGLQPSAMAVDPQGRFAVVTNRGSGGATLSVLVINASTGALTEAGAAIPLNVVDPQAVTISGNLVYVASANAVDVLIFTPASSSFAFAAGSPYSAGPAATNITALYSPPQASNLLYATDTSTKKLLAFTLGTGTLTAGTPLTLGTQPAALTADSQNHFLYVANQGSNNISVFTVDPTTGAVAAAGTPLVSTGTGPNALAYDATNNFLLVGLSGAKQVVLFSVNTSTGALSTTGSPFVVTNPASAMAVAKP